MNLKDAIATLTPEHKDYEPAAKFLRLQTKGYKLSPGQQKWADDIVRRAQEALNPTARPAPQFVGDVAPILSLIVRAGSRLKRPALLVASKAALQAAQNGYRISVASERARFPGSLDITSVERDMDGQRVWYGRIHKDGTFAPGKFATDDLAQALAEFCLDPVEAARRYGKLTGRCCFCSLPLTHEDSTTAGYGKICASHYGLPWGRTRTEVEYEAACEVREMHRHGVEGY